MPSLNDRLEQWLSEEGSEATAEYFAGYFRPSLRELGCSPTAPCSEEEWSEIRSTLEDFLGELEISIDALEQAAGETKRAREKGQTMREWMRESFRRHLSEERAEEALERGEQWLDAIDAGDLDAPPEPEDVLQYRQVLDLIGGGATLAALQEQFRRLSGGFSTN